MSSSASTRRRARRCGPLPRRRRRAVRGVGRVGPVGRADLVVPGARADAPEDRAGPEDPEDPEDRADPEVLAEDAAAACVAAGAAVVAMARWSTPVRLSWR